MDYDQPMEWEYTCIPQALADGSYSILSTHTCIVTNYNGAYVNDMYIPTIYTHVRNLLYCIVSNRSLFIVGLLLHHPIESSSWNYMLLH